MTERNAQVLLDKTGALYEQLIKNHDKQRADKLAAIMKKAVDEDVYIAFTGHYSAGKSSLINSLLLENILPTSPIPTSANVVVIRKGGQRVVLHTTEGACAELEGAYDKEAVQQFCKDGEQIETVEIFDDYKGVDPHVAYIDTPGIDSTDEAHFLSAASILHQADALFYVVHYNHVHSEENVLFLRSIKESIPNIYFIVNQIDRHDEAETPFKDYQAQVEDMLANEGISKDALFFTSVTEPEHPLNEIGSLRRTLKELEQQSKEQMLLLTEQKITNLLRDHTEMLTQQDEKDGPDFTEQLKTQTELVNSLKSELEETAKKPIQAEHVIKEEVNRILNNANLTPFEMRELAAACLESKEPGFKTGFLFSKTKTAQEKERRRADFFADVKKRTEAEADWHIIDTLNKQAKAFRIESNDCLKRIQAYRTPLHIDMIERAVKPGAKLSPEYVLTYTKDLADLIRREAKAKAAEIAEKLAAFIRDGSAGQQKEIQAQLQRETEKLELLQKKADTKQKNRAQADHIWALWNEELTNDIPQKPDWFKGMKKTVSAPLRKQEERPDAARRTQPVKIGDRNFQMQDHIQRFYQLSDLLGGFSMLSKQTEAFRGRIKRLEERQFTLALFGGFSSGKSSFANALVGERVLPSSPTPTTATINKVTKPINGKKHKTADVVFKTEDDIIAELVQLTGINISEQKGKSLSEKLQTMMKKGRLQEDQIRTAGNFLNAYRNYEQHIREQIVLTIPLDELKPYVAEETTACIVKAVTVYYTSPLTEKGITIVDTPGASSLNKRHTELAFQYIKDADAFFYMTYYQHSFSKGDKSFLRKLGLVKESLSMDKMFFVINAADLAENERELETVTDYVGSELAKEGIQQPQLYSVSSKDELQGKRETFYNRFPDVRASLDRFIEVDLMKESAGQLAAEADKLCETVYQLHESLHRSNEEKEAEKERLNESFESAAADIKQRRHSDVIIDKVKKDTQEQLYHIKQRLSFYANDLFKTAFYPGLQQGDWKANLKKALQDALKEYQFEFIQEIKTLDIRMTGFIEQHMTEEWMETCQRKLSEDGYFSIYMNGNHSRSLQLKEVEPELNESEFAQEQKEVKSPKQFFEQNGKAAFVEALRLKLLKVTENWIKKEEESLIARYAGHVESLQNESAKKALSQIQDQKETYLQGLKEGEAASEVESAYQACITWQKSDEEMKI
ncbi:dynamin family protein [Bacillus atrophaeus]|uniref:dynamin family protein n=1 Tax=Bacillus atrophaeus TaxID=1452 RepID=UPI00228005EC|nr:dynamin family protein [Bacillus atrophaeus]MCY8945793.1 dynamin family protein [Bacillus atrophaeus]